MASSTNRIFINYNVMIDIETLSTDPNAAIVSIGALKFNRKEGRKKLEDMNRFYVKVSRESCETLGMSVSQETLEWWKRQDEGIRYEALENPNDRVTIKEALEKLTMWINGSQHIWGHGDDFDCVVLTQAYKTCGLKVPWKYWNTRDTRTLFDIAGIHPWDLPPDDKHHPINDCYRQYVGVMMSLSKLNLI